VPGLGYRVNGVKLWIKLGRCSSSRASSPKIFLIIFLAGYCATSARLSPEGASRISGPLLVIWGAAMLVLVQTSDLGSALLNFGIFLAMV
jgi:cell division protein FtsW (lipid II flippase)